MKYHPATKRLETNDGKLIKRIHCPLFKQWNQLMPWTEKWSETRAYLEHGDLESSRETDFDQGRKLKRYCGSCQKCVLDVNDFSEAQITALVTMNPEICIHLNSHHPELEIVGGQSAESGQECGYGSRNRDGLLIIQTARSVAAVEEGIVRGCRPVFVKTDGESGVGMGHCVSYNRISRQLIVSGSHGLWGLGLMEDKEEWQDEMCFDHDDDKHASPLAAYMIPEGLAPGEEVYVADVIEDLPSQEFSTRGGSGTLRLKSARATWTGESLEFMNLSVVCVVG